MKFIETASAYNMFSPEEVEMHFMTMNKCKYSGKVTKVTDDNISECSSTLTIFGDTFTLKQGGFKATEMCEGGEDNLTQQYSGEIPKVGDTIYGIAAADTGGIMRIGKKSYDDNSYLPECRVDTTLDKICKSYNESDINYIYVVGVGVAILCIGIVIGILVTKNNKKKS